MTVAPRLCLLGDYDRGIVEFRAVRKALEMQLSGTPEAREFLKDLQREYRTILEYRSTLQDVAVAANKVQETQRRSKAAKERRLRQEREEQAIAVEEEAAKRDGLLKPCNGVLMFGPPGTGKTLLAKAVAHECGTTFFNVSASTLSSKYRGDSEKMVRILFDMARYYEPSIIFMDEIDAIASARGAATEHEASRRVKTELLVQINGVSSGEHDGSRVMLLAATNLPWELDEAMRRRLTKRVYIPLPEAEARRALFELNLRRIDVGSDVNLDALVEETEGYSGDDITNVCETELLLKMRREMEAGEDSRELETERLVVTKADFAEALSNVSKSVGHDQLRRFEQWEAAFGGVEAKKRRKLNHAEQKDMLEREICLLESGVAVLKTRNLPAHLVVEEDPILRPIAVELAALLYAKQKQQLHVAQMQSALSTCIFSENRFENEHGDMCCIRFDTVHYPGVASLQQVFDALSFFMTNMEIVISEQLGHVMLRDDYDTIEEEAFHIEGNAISFRHMFAEDDFGFGSEACGVFVVDCVDEDELHPRQPAEANLGTEEEELIVTMRRATFLKIRRPEFPVSELALEELHDEMMQWADHTSMKAFVNGKIWQWAGSRSAAGAFAEWMTVSDDGRVESVGCGEPPAAAEAQDLEGALVLPGLHDSHIHVSMLGESAEWLDLSGCRSYEAFAERLSSYDAAYPDKAWVVGVGWAQDELSTDARYPSRHDIDAVIRDRPVILHRACWHIAVVNTKALEIAGVDVAGKGHEVKHGAIDVDEKGATGILREDVGIRRASL
uniref:AAA+ ATPase domain-containing protein n=1 Tax=Phytophthora ramorum TaxID=164328 RepID=H3HEB0_PHYRM